MIGRKLIALAFAFCAALDAPEAEPLPDVDAVAVGAHPSALESDPRAMAGLEARGLGLARLFGADKRTNDALAKTPHFAAIAAAIEADLRELDARPGIGPDPLPNRPFDARWLRDPRARFELVGAVHRLDRKFVEGPGSRSACGEARLVYRLVLEPIGRPATPLPMTINVIFPQHEPCDAAARAWTELPARGRARVDALAAIYRSLGPYIKVETNLQNLHGPALRAAEDDHAEYLLRSFEVTRGELVPKPLLDTPNPDLADADRAALASWIREHFQEIDDGSYVIPDRFLASRTVSVAPRGAARKKNRPFARLFDASAFADLPYERARLVRSPAALLRRLDQGTCTGCHETRAIAGFHMLGEDRDPDARFNALALGISNHFAGELPWRDAMIEATARGRTFDAPRPFAERGGREPGMLGAHCGIGDAFASWTCAPGLRCRDLYADPDGVGVCAPDDANHEGDACEDARAEGDMGPDGDRVHAKPKEGCVFEGRNVGLDACSPNHFGFPGGMCSDECKKLGRVRDGFVCADLPSSGYETDCFPKPIPIEKCLETHFARRIVRGCDAAHPCRDDYACARVPGLAANEGACVPPYFVFQARVDGPMLDR
ncbi:MAG TPA: hypothetical protein VIF62_12685 [Labilithrix sp.]